MNQIKILISDTAPLYPPLWGGPKRIWGLFSNISSQFEITYIGIDTGQKESAKKIQAAKNFLERRFSMPGHYYKLWLPIQKFWFKDLNFDLFTYFFMPWAKKYARAIKNERADLLVASHPWAFTCMKKKSGQPLIYDAHNCEFLLMRALSKGNPFERLLSYWTKKIEAGLCQKCNAILVCSNQDKQNFIKLYGLDHKKIHIIKNGTSISPLPSLAKKRAAKKALGLSEKPIILFVGAYYKPNIEAASYIIKTLAKSFPDCGFIIVGTVKNAFSDKKIPKNVTLTGLVSNERLGKYWRAADLAINPITKGSGVNIKVLDYMAVGIPTVSTPFGCRGLDVKDRDQVVLSGLNDFRDTIKKTLENPELCKRLSKQGHAFAAQNYDWKKISKDLEKVLFQLTF